MLDVEAQEAILPSTSAFFNELTEAVLLVQASGVIRAASPAAAFFWGLSPAAMQEKSIDSLFDIDSPQDHPFPWNHPATADPGANLVAVLRVRPTNAKTVGISLQGRWYRFPFSPKETWALLLTPIEQPVSAALPSISQKQDSLAEDQTTGDTHVGFATVPDIKSARLLTTAPHVPPTSPEIAHSAEWLATLLNHSADAVFTLDENGVIGYWNDGATRVYGYTAAEALGQPISLLLMEGTTEEAELCAARAHGTVLENFVARRRHKKGHSLLLAISSSPFIFPKGTLPVTARFEREITALQEFQAVREQAAADSRTKREFVANISHELRTPMNAILGMIDLSRRHQDLPPALHDYLGTAHDSARALLALVNDLLDFSRLEASGLEIENQPFHLREIFDDALQTLALRAHHQKLQLACHVLPNVPDLLQGDGRRLRQVLINLVGNAIKFTAQGEVFVSVTATPTVADHTRLTIRVRDTGTGVPEEMRERIFEPFTQVDSSDTRSHGGTGLGLPISRKILTLMGGKIWCEANEGPGSTFVVQIDLPVISYQTELPPAVQKQLDKSSILVIEGHRPTQTILEDLLASWGMVVTIASDPVAAATNVVTGTQDTQCDLVLLDTSLQNAEGQPILKLLGTRPLLESVLLLAEPGELNAITLQTSGIPGITGCLERPVSQSALLDAVVRSRQGQSAAGRATWIAPITQAVRPLRILLAEDTRANQKVIVATLQLRGHRVDAVDNGQDAVSKASRRHYDVILMDLRMPLLGGIDACIAIRGLTDEQRASVPIVALTAHVLATDRQRCLQAGMNDFITKPIDADEMIRSVEAAAEARPHRRQSRPLSRDLSVKAQEAIPEQGRPPEMPSVINVSRALERMGGQRQLLKEVAQFFIEDVPLLYEALTKALEIEDHAEAERAAHSIKGLASNFDALELQETAAQMERLVREAHLTTARELMSRLQIEIDAVYAALRTELLE